MTEAAHDARSPMRTDARADRASTPAADRFNVQARASGLTGDPMPSEALNVMLLSACTNRACDLAAELTDTRTCCQALSSFEDLRDRRHAADVLVMELLLPDVDGIEVIRYLGQQVTQPELIFISDLDPRIVAAARRLAQSRGLTVRATLPMDATARDVATVLSKPAHTETPTSRAPLILTDHHHLRRGLANDEFVVHFQPKIDVGTLGLVSVEALVRWRHPDYGLLGPDSFVQLAEKSGLISPLTDAIVEKAFGHATDWREAGIPLKVAINVSGASLADLSLPDQLTETARKFGLSPDNIVVEITESWVVKNSIDALDILTRLRMKGFHLSIDDFGTGYSTMLKLKQIPFSELKLDQSIIRGAANDPDARTIVETSIDLGHRLGLHLVAEGVERQDDWDLISELGCNEGQGFFIARPMTAKDLPDWLNRWNRSLGI